MLGISFAFGGPTWLISDADINLGPLDSGSTQCVGVIHALGLADTPPPGNPVWIIGDTFLMCSFASLVLKTVFSSQANVEKCVQCLPC
jgi:Eukaryotic aspartyl protease